MKLTTEQTYGLAHLVSTRVGVDLATNFVKLPAAVQQSVAQHVATLAELAAIMERLQHGYSKRN